MAKTLSDISAPDNKSIRRSDGFLKAKHNLLSRFSSVEDLVTDEKRLNEAERSAIEYHILNLRAAITRTLWANEIYIGRSLLDDYVLDAAKTGTGDVAARVINALADAGAERPGFVLYPLTRFGMEIPPMFSFQTSTLKGQAVFCRAGFAVSAQGNSVEAAFENVKRMARGLGVKQRIDFWDIKHFAHSAKWFATNPLMMVKLISYTGDAYENQFVYTIKIRIAASSVLMLHSLSSEAGEEVDRFNSSGHVNNFETLDIRHYLIGEAIPGRGRAIFTRRVPMNVAALDLARLSDIAATISTETLETSRMRRLEANVNKALKIVERGYLRHVNLTTRSKVESRLYRRLVTALDWFRASFGSSSNESEAVVSLAVAFETLLTDHYKRGVANHIERRVGICLKGVKGVSKYKANVRKIYYGRSEIVHSGSLDQSVNIAQARVAFALCFCAVSDRLATWVPVDNEPLRNLLNDR